VTLGLAVYAGIRLYLKPRSLSHSFVRLTLLVAHVFIFLVCIDTASTTVGVVAGGFKQLMPGEGATQPWNMVQGQDFSGSQYSTPEGAPDDATSPPSGFGPGPAGPSTPGRGMGSP
jgi:hypothetical protein